MGLEIIHRVTCDECCDTPRNCVAGDAKTAEANARQASYVKRKDGQWLCEGCQAREKREKERAKKGAKQLAGAAGPYFLKSAQTALSHLCAVSSSQSEAVLMNHGFGSSSLSPLAMTDLASRHTFNLPGGPVVTWAPTDLGREVNWYIKQGSKA